MADPTRCPTLQVLLEFGHGKLDPAKTQSLEQHLDTCMDCRNVIGSLSGEHPPGQSSQPQPPAGRHGTRVGGSSGSASVAGKSIASLSAAGQVPQPSHQPSAVAAVPPELTDHPDYEIVRELGQGGMGVVYLARNRMMDRLEVLKVVSRSLLDRPGALERFQQEIRSAAKLAHPNIVAAYSVIRPGNLLVLCMEYVDGQDLGETVKQRGPLPVVNAAFYIHQVALGLQHAHDKGMVHRDIKPGNLMLAVVNKKHVVKILDFGLAKATSEKMQDGGLTKSGQMLGTPDYIAPEQTLDAQKADVRADIYSLGCTLYYLLSGRPPFDGASLYEILHAHHSVEAKPLNLVRPEVPPELAAVVAKMMAKDPAQRYQAPIEVAQALKPFFHAASHTAKADQSLPPQAAPPIPPQPPLPLPGQSGPIPVPLARAVPLPAAQYRPVAATAPGLADLETMASASGFKPAVNPKVQNNSGRWKPPVILVTAGLAGMLLLAAVMFKVRSQDGILAITVNEPSPEVTIDGEQVKVSWADGGKQAELRVPAGSHKIELKKDGFKIIGESVAIERAGRLFLSAKLEPLPKPEQETVGATADEPASGKRQLAGASAQPSAQPAASDQQTGGLAPAARQANVYTWPPGTPSPAVAPFDATKARQHQEAWARHVGAPVEQTNSIGMKLVLIPPGEFMMGNNPEDINGAAKMQTGRPGPDLSGKWLRTEVPRHRVAITKPYFLSATEVTIGQFRQFADAAKYVTQAEQTGVGNAFDTSSSQPGLKPEKGLSWRTAQRADQANIPVTQITWNDAVEFSNWLSGHEGLQACYWRDKDGDWQPVPTSNGYRLPSEAEWEFACRAGTTTHFSSGNDVALLSGSAWSMENSGSTQPVGRKRANPFGLHDMHGNVCEWCNDQFSGSYYWVSPAADPQGAEFGTDRAVRGGQFSYFAYIGRSASRGSNTPSYRAYNLGFRVTRAAGTITAAVAVKNSANEGPSSTSTAASRRPATPLPPTPSQTLEPATGAPDDDGWVSLFNGRDLSGWSATENSGAFSVRDGCIVAHGPRSHLFYVGPVRNHLFKDFELRAVILTKPGTNSGIYFHTAYQENGFPKLGFEVQVNNTGRDPKKTGGLYGIQDVFRSPVRDNEWFTVLIAVRGKHVTVEVDGKQVVDWTEPDDFEARGANDLKLGRGTFALQAHDPGSEVYFKQVEFRAVASEASQLNLALPNALRKPQAPN